MEKQLAQYNVEGEEAFLTIVRNLYKGFSFQGLVEGEASLIHVSRRAKQYPKFKLLQQSGAAEIILIKKRKHENHGPGRVREFKYGARANHIHNLAVKNVKNCQHTDSRDCIWVCNGMNTTRPLHLTRALNLRTIVRKIVTKGNSLSRSRTTAKAEAWKVTAQAEGGWKRKACDQKGGMQLQKQGEKGTKRVKKKYGIKLSFAR